MFISIAIQIDRMNYYGVCSIEEYERINIEQVLIDSLRSEVDTNVIQFNNVKCVRMDREVASEEEQR